MEEKKQLKNREAKKIVFKYEVNSMVEGGWFNWKLYLVILKNMKQLMRVLF